MQSYNVLYVRFDTLCASQIIFGKIYPLEMLFLSFGPQHPTPHNVSNLPQYFLLSWMIINNVHVVLLRKLQQRAV